MKIKNGITRKVFLIGNYAIKIPQTRYGFKMFISGLLGNMQEKDFSSINDPRMCPVKFCTKGGFLLIMPRCKAISEQEFLELNINDFWSGSFRVPVEYKQCSFGWLNGKIVAIDYGS